MNAKELNLKINTALDFLCSMQNIDGTFMPKAENGSRIKGETPFLQHLFAISLFTELGRNHPAAKALKYVESITFRTPSDARLIRSGESLTAWSAMASIIYAKRQEMDLARMFAENILPRISAKSVSSGQNKDEPSNNNGLIALSMLVMYEKTGMEVYLQAASMIAEFIVAGRVKYDQFDVWVMSKLMQIDPDERYDRHARHIISALDRMFLKSLTSLFAGITQQSYFATYPHIEWFAADKDEADQKHVSLLSHQIGLQVDKGKRYRYNHDSCEGGFFRNSRVGEIRIDYVVHNILAMWQYTCHLEQKEYPAI